MKTPRRIAITGIGMVTPLGLNTATTWQQLLAGRSGVERIRGFEVSGFATQIGAEVKNFDPAHIIHDTKLLKFAIARPRICAGCGGRGFGRRRPAPDRANQLTLGLQLLARA